MFIKDHVKNKFVRGKIGITVTYIVNIEDPTKFSDIYRNWSDYIDNNNEETTFQGLNRCDCIIGDKLEDIKKLY
jgi:hypothetical protein